ncbi:hypothetical protein ABDK75_10485 [Gluconobacter sp. OJA]|uniref:hypothetical protein n=1 Tax=Gluconobacter sp. OJA TaxID=3145197 RepID=UPI0031F8A648
MIQLFNSSRDEVIKSSVSQGATEYRYALKNLLPLLDKFSEQRKVQRRKFYERLQKDILKGCLMPPITLAFVDKRYASITDQIQIQEFVSRNISEGYVLDGMQRLTTLKEAESDEKFNPERPLYLNVIIAERYDLLLYRMITLNNGQKPMTARHQIEMLTKGLIDTGNLSIEIVSEKETEAAKFPGSFKRADIAAAYTAFLTNSVNNENSRIIESKLDEILVGKVMEANLEDSDVNFDQILSLIDKFSSNEKSKNWLRLANNLIGFSVGVKKGFSYIDKMSAEDFERASSLFDDAFSAMNSSKINVGKFRRELSKLFFEKIEQYYDLDVEDLQNVFLEATLVD